MKRKKLTITVVLALLVLVVVVAALVPEGAFLRWIEKWKDTLILSFTLLTLLVTAAYVYFTYGLLKATSATAEMALEQTLRERWKVVAATHVSVDTAYRHVKHWYEYISTKTPDQFVSNSSFHSYRLHSADLDDALAAAKEHGMSTVYSELASAKVFAQFGDKQIVAFCGHNNQHELYRDAREQAEIALGHLRAAKERLEAILKPLKQFQVDSTSTQSGGAG